MEKVDENEKQCILDEEGVSISYIYAHLLMWLNYYDAPGPLRWSTEIGMGNDRPSSANEVAHKGSHRVGQVSLCQ